MRRYDYDVEYPVYPGYPAPFPGTGWMAPEAWAWGGFPALPYGPFGVPGGYAAYDPGYRPRRRPEESPTYGRGGDRALREWARRYGYDVEYEIRPRLRGSGPRYGRGGYDREWRR